MLGIFKAEEVGSLGDGLSVVKIDGGSLHHEVADDGGSCLACGLTHKVTEIVGREKLLLGTITDGGQAKLALTPFAIIVSEQIIETFQ